MIIEPNNVICENQNEIPNTNPSSPRKLKPHSLSIQQGKMKK